MFNRLETTNWENTGATNLDGETVTKTQILADGTLDGRFTVANGWTVQNGKLPDFGTPLNMPIQFAIVGSGLEGDPYIFTSAEQVAQLALYVYNGLTYKNKYLKMGNDIDLSAYQSGKGWMLIGNWTGGWVPGSTVGRLYPFKGIFNGDNKKITGLKINFNDFALFLGKQKYHRI